MNEYKKQFQKIIEDGLPAANLDLQDMEGEIWMDVFGFDGIYSVSNLGRIKSEEIEIRCGKGWATKKSRMMKQTVTKSNPKNKRFTSYSLKVSFSYENKRSSRCMSEVVGAAFLGPKKKGEVYGKINKIWYDCRLDNLKIMPRGENIADAYKMGYCDRNKESLKRGQKPAYIFKRLSDGKEFIGGPSLKKEYGYDIQGGIKGSVKSGNPCKGDFWKLIPIFNH